MNDLNKLPELTEHALCELKADDRLRFQIIQTYEAHRRQKSAQDFRLRLRHSLPVLFAALSLMVICAVLLNQQPAVIPDGKELLIYSYTAGDAAPTFSWQDLAGIDPDSIQSVVLENVKYVFDRHLFDCLGNSLPVDSETDIPATFNSHLDFYDKEGMFLSLPAQPPFIQFADGTRRCETFFDLLSESH